MPEVRSRSFRFPGTAPRNGNPACWRWGPPTDAALERVRQEWTGGKAELGAHYTDDDWRWMLMCEWHRSRCAICGFRFRDMSYLVTDHDHKTGLVRGFLCRSCNTNEGVTGCGPNIFTRYRERNPATICGVKAAYVGW